jgi:hypothetical protein
VSPVASILYLSSRHARCWWRFAPRV